MLEGRALMQGLDLEVRGKTARWGGAAWAVLCACVAVGLVFRLKGLSLEGVGDDEVTKEDPLLGLFLMLMLWCFAEAKAAADDAAAGEPSRAVDQRRWEIGAAASLAAMLASKYFFFFAPIPVVLYFWIRSDTRWRLPWRRWFELGGVAFCIWVCLIWSPVLPR